MPRYTTDLHSLTKAGRLSQKHFLIVASQIIDVLMHLHSKHYVHSDIKAENIMIGLCSGFTKTSIQCDQHKRSKSLIQYAGANPLRSCRVKDSSGHAMYKDMVKSHYLRPSRSIITYTMDENSRSSRTPESDHASDNPEQDEDFELSPRKRKPRRVANNLKGRRNDSRSVKCAVPPTLKTSNKHDSPSGETDSDDRVFVIDYGLATKFIDTNGEHKPFCMDQRRAHDGTLEFTSRDAHFGAHSRRSDLECLGYNLIYWSQGFLPWKDDKLKEQPEIVHRLKEVFMTDAKEIMKLLYGKNVPKYLGDFMHYVSQLEFDEEPNYAYLKGLFEKEFVRLGYQKLGMRLNLVEMRDQCEPIYKNSSESDLMMSTISDLKTARKLGFLIATDTVDSGETQAKPNETISLNVSCKASPKNLRSKEKVKGKRPKRQPKMTEKELISEKMALGKKLSIAEIATLDPDQIARDRADREYEKFDEKVYYQTPQRYKGNPTYAILDIQSKLRNKHVNSLTVAANNDIEPIKGYTKPMMDVLKKQQLLVEQQLTPVSTYQLKRNREGLRNVIKPTQKNLTLKNSSKGKKQGRKTSTKSSKLMSSTDDEVAIDENVVPATDQQKLKTNVLPRKKPVRRRREVTPEVLTDPVVQPESDDTSSAVSEIQLPMKRKRGRPRIVRNIIEPPETEEDSVYYDIPGEGSNDGIKEISEEENEPEILPQKRSIWRVTPSDEISSQASIASESSIHKKKTRGRYYADDDYDASTDEATNMSSATNVTKSSESFKPRRGRHIVLHEEVDVGTATRNKIKSRSTSRSAAVYTEASDRSEVSDVCNDSEYQLQSDEESGDEMEDQALEFEESETEVEEEEYDEDDIAESELADNSNDSEDSIDIKYSPIKTRHARRRINLYNMKQIRGQKVYNSFPKFYSLISFVL